MSKDQILNQVKDLMSQQFEIEPKEITLDTNFQEDLDADSIDLTEFILTLEDAFGKEIPDEDAIKIKTVSNAVNYINEHQD